MQVLIVPDLFAEKHRWQHVLSEFSTAGVYAEVIEYAPPRTDDVSEIVDMILERLIDETYIIGTGIGGRIAIQLAARKPHHLVGIMVTSTPALPAPGVSSFFARLLHIALTPVRILIPRFIREKSIELLSRLRHTDPQKQLYRKISKPEMSAFLGKVSDPLILLWGKHDKQVPTAVAEKMHETLNDADVPHDYIVVDNGAAHLEQTHPSLVADTVLSRITTD